jgi:RND superfamily putative drug exporter
VRLTVRSGPDEGATAEIAGTRFVIGRDEDCDLVLTDEGVSRRHAELSVTADGAVVVTDLGSSNGTFVNGREIEAPVELRSNQDLRVGDSVIALREPSKTVLVRRGVTLRLESGGERGQEVEVFGRDFVVGREEACQLVLPDPTVSARHASFAVLANGETMVTDLGSRNGTFVNGRQVYEPVELRGGERLRCGDAVLSFMAPERRGGTVVAPAGIWLTIDSGPQRGKTLKVTGERFVIGREEGADLVLEDPLVSREHATLRVIGDGIAVLTDLGSSNGTFVEGRRIDAPVQIDGQERIRIGGVELHVGEEQLAPRVERTLVGRTVADGDVGATAAPDEAPTRPPRLSTEALARATARRPWLTLAIWLLALVVSGGYAAARLEGVLTAEGAIGGNPESKRADTLLAERLRGPSAITELVVLRSPRLTVTQSAFRQQAGRVRRQVLALGPEIVAGGEDFYATRNPALVSSDRRALLLPFVLAGDFQRAQHDVLKVVDVVERADRSPGFDVHITGEASIASDFERVAEEDLKTGESIGLAVAFLVLISVFGTLVASLLPVLMAVFAIGIALGVAAVLGQGITLVVFVVNMIVGMGLALGIDYSLFVLTRYREERATGHDVKDAIARAGATSGGAVLFSGMAVVLALVGMSFVPDPTLRSLGIGAILVGTLSVLAALTLLPAMLSLLGDRIDRIHVPLLGRSAATGGSERRFWGRVADAIMRRPVLSLVAATTVLLAATVPVFGLSTGTAGVSTLPDSEVSKRGFVAVRSGFPTASATPAEIVVDGDVASSPVRAAIGRLRAALGQEPVFGPAELEQNDRRDLALLSVAVKADAKSTRATDAVKRLRAELIPRAFSGVDVEVLVTGATAQDVDYVRQTNRALPFVIAFVLVLSFILLTFAFRSIVVPLKAIALNLLSVGAAYGVLVLVFQKGVGADLLGLRQVDRVEAWVPLFLFAVLFGLSMDYHVFLLTRIRERFNETGDNTEAVRHALSSSARVITGAALIMVAVFTGFALGELVPFQQLGVGMAVALLLDATIIRSVLVPASMKLLGARNWYLPRWLRWLPEVSVEGTAEPMGRRPRGALAAEPASSS